MSDDAPRDEMAAVIAAMSGLADLLETETATLRRGAFSELAPLLQEKTALAKRYETAWNGLRTRLDPTAASRTPGQKQAQAQEQDREAELRAVFERLEAVLTENERTIRAVRDAVAKVVEVIVDQARHRQDAVSAATRTGVYGRDGRQR